MVDICRRNFLSGGGDIDGDSSGGVDGIDDDDDGDWCRLFAQSILAIFVNSDTKVGHR